MSGLASMSHVAAEELLDMKRDTIAIYGADFDTSSRPQDFVEVGILGGLSDGSAVGSQGGTDGEGSHGRERGWPQ